MNMNTIVAAATQELNAIAANVSAEINAMNVAYKYELGQVLGLTVSNGDGRAQYHLQVRITARQENLGQPCYLVETLDGTHYMAYAIEASSTLGTELFASDVYRYRDNEDRVIAAELCGFTIEPSQQVYEIGDVTTCQMGNPGDTSWTHETHAHVEVKILARELCEITKRMYYLVQDTKTELVGRAAVARPVNRGDEYDISKHGMLYCTSARRYGSRAQKWTGINSIQEAASSLGFVYN